MKGKRVLKPIALALTMFMSATTFFACNGNSQSSSGSNDDLSGSINISVPIGEKEKIALEHVIEAYNEIHPSVNITVSQQDDSQYRDWLSKQLTSDTKNITADIVVNNQVSQFFSTNKFVDYSDYLSRSNPYANDQIWSDTLMEPAFRANGAKGEIYSLNFESTQIVFFYNKKIFQQAGLTVGGTTTGEPKTPKDWDEMVDFCKKISETSNSKGQKYSALAIPGDSESFWTGTMGWLMRIYADQYFRSFINSARAQEGDYCYNSRIDSKWAYQPLPSDYADVSADEAFELAIYNDSPSRVTTNDLRVIKMLQQDEVGPSNPKFQDMLKNLMKVIPVYTQAGFSGSKMADAQNAFWGEKSAIYFGGTDFFKSYYIFNDGVKEEDRVEIGTFYCPPMKHAGTVGGEPDIDVTRSLGGPQGYYGIINKTQKQNDLVMDFMMFWASKQGQENLFESIENQNWYLNGKVFIKDLVIPDSINPSKDLVFQGECDLNPIQLVARGLGSEPLSIRDFQTNISNLFDPTNKISIETYCLQMQKSLKKYIPNYLADRGYKDTCLDNPALNPYY